MIIVLLPVARWLTSVVNHNDVKKAINEPSGQLAVASVGSIKLALAENDTREGENDSLDAVEQNYY